MNAASLTTSTIRLLNASNNPVAGTITYNATTFTATFTPTAPLANTASYTLDVVSGVAGVQDSFGDPLSADVKSTFTTAAAPTVTSITPVASATNVSNATTITVVFAQTMDATSLTSSTVQLLNPSAVLVPSTVTYNSTTRTATITPTALLNGSTNYTVVVISGASGVRDANENVMTTDARLMFTTAAAPTVTSITPVAGATNVSISTAITVVFGQAMNAASVSSSTVQLLTPSAVAVAATVTYNAATQTATLTPTSPLTGNTAYTVIVSSGLTGVRDSLGNAFAISPRLMFTTTNATPATYSVFGSTTPTLVDAGDTSAVQLGAKFQATSDGYITAIRFYKSTANTGTHIGYLWSTTGTLLAQVTFTNETASGWQQATLSTPVLVKANTTYIVSYLAPKGHYSDAVSYFATTGVTNGPLTELANSANSNNGVYLYGNGGVDADRQLFVE